nr:hypothetical protein [Clostridium beijerinckii]
MGIIYWNMGYYYDAKKCFEEILRHNPNDAESLARFGYMQYKLDSRAECGQIMEDAFKREPNNSEVLHVIFKYYRDKGEKDKLKKILEKYLESSASELRKLLMLGDYEMSMKQYKKAKEYYKQAFLLNPKEKYLHTQLTLIDLRYFIFGLSVDKIFKIVKYLIIGLFSFNIICVGVADSFGIRNIIHLDKITPYLIILLICSMYVLKICIIIYNRIFKFVMKKRGLQ